MWKESIVRPDGKICRDSSGYRYVILGENIVTIEQHHGNHVQEQVLPGDHLVSDDAAIFFAA